MISLIHHDFQGSVVVRSLKFTQIVVKMTGKILGGESSTNAWLFQLARWAATRWSGCYPAKQKRCIALPQIEKLETRKFGFGKILHSPGPTWFLLIFGIQIFGTSWKILSKLMTDTHHKNQGLPGRLPERTWVFWANDFIRWFFCKKDMHLPPTALRVKIR